MHWVDHGSGIDSAGFIVLDGFTVPGQFLFGQGAAQRSGVRVSKTEERPFVFVNATTSGTSASNLQALGTIVLKIKRVKRKSLSHRPNGPIMPPAPESAGYHAGFSAAVG